MLCRKMLGFEREREHGDAPVVNSPGRRFLPYISAGTDKCKIPSPARRASFRRIRAARAVPRASAHTAVQQDSVILAPVRLARSPYIIAASAVVKTLPYAARNWRNLRRREAPPPRASELMAASLVARLAKKNSLADGTSAICVATLATATFAKKMLLPSVTVARAKRR